MMDSNFNFQLPGDDVDLFRELTPSPTSFEPDVGASNSDNFPTILHDIVSNEATDDCIHWLPSGRHFTITDKEKVSLRREQSILFRAIFCSNCIYLDLA